MLLTILHADRDRCDRCTSPLSKAGFVVADATGRRAFLCMGHLDELLGVCLVPPRCQCTGSAVVDRTKQNCVGA